MRPMLCRRKMEGLVPRKDDEEGDEVARMRAAERRDIMDRTVATFFFCLRRLHGRPTTL